MFMGKYIKNSTFLTYIYQSIFLYNKLLIQIALKKNKPKFHLEFN